MKLWTSGNIIMWLLVSLLVISLPFCLSLLIVEYVRVFILGTVLAIVTITFPGAVHKTHIRMCLIAGAYAYALWLFDPAVNGVAFFGKGAIAFNGYRIITSIILLIAILTLIFPVITRKMTLNDFLSGFTKTDGYILIGICVVGLLFTFMEMARSVSENTPVIQAIFRGTKLIDIAFIYVLVIRSSYDKESLEKKRVYTLLYSFMIFSVFTSLAGAGKAAQSYYIVRIPPRSHNLKIYTPRFLQDIRKNLLRVFSLNSREAILVYESGYKAGMKEWKQSLKKLEKTSRFPNLGIEEEKIIAEIELGRYSDAIMRLERMPLNYRFASSHSAELKQHISEKLRSGSGGDELYYLLGMLSMHIGNEADKTKYLKEYISVRPDNANALYFLNNGDTKKLKKYKRFEMQAKEWLNPRSMIKSVEKSDGKITILYNQQVAGEVWLIPGQYKVTVWARDDGVAYEKACATGFDPTCKARVWIGDSFKSLRVLSTNRLFKAYSFDTEIKSCPTEVVVEFTNDTHDKEHGWDRNLSISRVEFTPGPGKK